MNQNLPMLVWRPGARANFGTTWTAEARMPKAKGKLGHDLDGRMDTNLHLVVRRHAAKGKFRHDLDGIMNQNLPLLVRMPGANGKFWHDLDGRINQNLLSLAPG
jgi:hypothetical protein